MTGVWINLLTVAAGILLAAVLFGMVTTNDAALYDEPLISE